jgi:hypothetical protein
MTQGFLVETWFTFSKEGINIGFVQVLLMAIDGHSEGEHNPYFLILAPQYCNFLCNASFSVGGGIVCVFPLVGIFISLVVAFVTWILFTASLLMPMS